MTITVKNLTQRYGDRVVLRLPEWTLAAGERSLVIGPSGCGKSTLLHILAGLQRPSEGQVSVFDRDVFSLSKAELDRWRGATVGIVLQALHLVSHLSVRANLRLAQYLAHRPQDERAVDGALSSLGVADKSERRPRELSQGEQQRVAIARAVVNGPRLLLADEPTANLDDAAAARAIELLLSQAERHGATLVVATHDSRVRPHFRKTLDLSR
jgi:putative ABC transport system ATP-binding protein